MKVRIKLEKRPTEEMGGDEANRIAMRFFGWTSLWAIVVIVLCYVLGAFNDAKPVQAQAPALSVRAHVAPLKTAVRQLKSGKWRVTLETADSAVGRLQKGQGVTVTVR